MHFCSFSKHFRYFLYTFLQFFVALLHLCSFSKHLQFLCAFFANFCSFCVDFMHIPALDLSGRPWPRVLLHRIKHSEPAPTGKASPSDAKSIGVRALAVCVVDVNNFFCTFFFIDKRAVRGTKISACHTNRAHCRCSVILTLPRYVYYVRETCNVRIANRAPFSQRNSAPAAPAALVEAIRSTAHAATTAAALVSLHFANLTMSESLIASRDSMVCVCVCAAIIHNVSALARRQRVHFSLFISASAHLKWPMTIKHYLICLRRAAASKWPNGPRTR